MSSRRWDVITCDPVHPLYGSAPLYTLDFFRLCRSRLKPGGQVYQYLPLHHMPTDAFRQAIGTFSAAFPHSRVLFTLGHGVLIGSNDPIPLDWALWTERLRRFERPDDLIASSLQTAAQFAAMLQLDSASCRAVSLGPVATDRRPVLEFLEPAAFEPGLWQANARTLIEAYAPPLGEIRGLPAPLVPAMRRLIAGKRLLLFSQLERGEGRMGQARSWLIQALRMAPDDPEITYFGRQAQAEGWLR